jgi:hypothetical protein
MSLFLSTLLTAIVCSYIITPVDMNFQEQLQYVLSKSTFDGTVGIM